MRPSLLAAVLACTALVAPARAQIDSREGIMLQNQILELRRDIQILQQQGGPSRGGYDRVPPSVGQGGGSDLSAQLLDRVQTLEDQVRRLRGQLDEQSNALRVAQDQLAKQIADLNFKLNNGAPSAPAPTTGPSVAPPTQGRSEPAAPAAAPRRTPELALQEGNAALARRDYPVAEAAAREVLAAGKTSPKAADANFLLAQSMMGQRNFQGAAVAYDDAYNRGRTGSRAPDALLGLANALTGLNERPAACATLDKLRREFPNVRGTVRGTASTLRGRNGCG